MPKTSSTRLPDHVGHDPDLARDILTCRAIAIASIDQSSKNERPSLT